MLLNESKTKSMIINFSNNYQFSTRLLLNRKNVEIVDNMKILGTIFTDKLNWDKNCDQMISKVNKKIYLDLVQTQRKWSTSGLSTVDLYWSNLQLSGLVLFPKITRRTLKELKSLLPS